MYKKLMLFSLLPCLCSAVTPDKAETESKLLHEIFLEQLEQRDIETNWSFDGEINFSAVAVKQDVEFDDSFSTAMDGDIYLRYQNTFFDDYGWGLVIGTKAQSGIIKQGSAIVDSSYLYLEGDKLGKLKFGYTNSAADTFSICYASALTGCAGADGANFSSFIGQTSGTIIGTGFDKDDGKCLKVVWLSPMISGWSCGLSYSRNSRDGHLFKEKRNKTEKDYSPTQNFADQSGYMMDNFTGGISYEYGDLNDFNCKVALAGWFGRGMADLKKVRHIRGYNLGAILGYKEFKLALGYTDNAKSMLSANLPEPGTTALGATKGANNGKVYNIGLGYNDGKWEFSTGYFYSVKKFTPNDKATAKIATVAAQYNVNKTFSVYVEYDNIRMKTTDRIYNTELDSDGFAYGNNRANMFVFGTKVRI